MLELCGFRILLECPLDLSALASFVPIPAVLRASPTAADAVSSSDLIAAQPWYKTVAGLLLWDPFLIDAVLVSTPAALLGLPFLARNSKFKAKVVALDFV